MKAIVKIFAMLLIAAMASFFIACSEDEENPVVPPKRTVTGSWTGTISVGGTMTLNLAQSGSTVTGTGFITAGSFNQACTVPSGTCNDPDISLIIAIQGYQDVSYTGKFTADNIHKGNLNGSGFAGEAITFVK